jgi:hypothetical protein
MKILVRSSNMQELELWGGIRVKVCRGCVSSVVEVGLQGRKNRCSIPDAAFSLQISKLSFALSFKTEAKRQCPDWD